ncbi:hypothetical protein S40285_00839 [Stachybotrys chlorohalonatus IBT 40285]|uniref:CS domain-containing protein n=1 Tax=Stachybotrys chlorohalonatus (strain IBT 40285) TaxID=1283841 RepID=A0A084QJS1_STAC4|nr:hypothetical protein S40285_00839 [Stachybotrys chlorohalonata IBT 40285]
MAQKCVHQGCGKNFSDPNEKCEYHPGPPVFHEGQKGWKCCKPRVLTFDEFMEIPPCTTGVHSTTDKPPAMEEKPQQDDAALAKKIDNLNASAPTRQPIQAAQAAPSPPPPPPESEDDDPNLEIADGQDCRRRACGAKYKKGSSRDGEKCVHHPGVPIFHEGSKGYSCCKRRVLEFDQFMKIEGCKTKDRHLFIGSGKKGTGVSTDEEVLSTVRHDFYQTSANVIASFFLKKIVKDTAKVEFRSKELALDLKTSDSPPKKYTAEVPLFGTIDPEKSSFKIMGTKLEVVLVKADGASWPVLRSDEALTGEILQVGRAGRAYDSGLRSLTYSLGVSKYRSSNCGVPLMDQGTRIGVVLIRCRRHPVPRNLQTGYIKSFRHHQHRAEKRELHVLGGIHRIRWAEQCSESASIVLCNTATVPGNPEADKAAMS